MIKIQVAYKEGKFLSLLAKGHAGSAPHGEDLVCAAASAIIQGGVQALTDGDENYSLHMEKGELELKRLTPNMSEHDEIVIQTIYVQLESLACAEQEYVRLERKQK